MAGSSLATAGRSWSSRRCRREGQNLGSRRRCRPTATSTISMPQCRRWWRGFVTSCYASSSRTTCRCTRRVTTTSEKTSRVMTIDNEPKFTCATLRFTFTDDSLTCDKAETARDGSTYGFGRIVGDQPGVNDEVSDRVELYGGLLRLLMGIIPSGDDAERMMLRKHIDEKVCALAEQLGETLYKTLFDHPTWEQKLNEALWALQRKDPQGKDVAEKLELLRIEF